MMKEFIYYLFQSSVCLVIFFLLYQLAYRYTTFFQFNRYYLISGIILSFILPCGTYTYDVVVPPFSQNTTSSEIIFYELQANTVQQNINVWIILFIIFLIGSLIILYKEIRTFCFINKLIRQGKKDSINGYSIIKNPACKSPFTFLNNIIIGTESGNQNETNLILLHEYFHIKEKHWIDLLVCDVLLLFQWYNPFAWKYILVIKENHEYMVDKHIMQDKDNRETYMKLLINYSLKHTIFNLSNSFYLVKTSKRLIMMKKDKTKSWRKVAIAALIPFFSLYIWAFSEPNYVTTENHFIQSADSIDEERAIKIAEELFSEIENKYSISKEDALRSLLIINGKEYPNLNLIMIDPLCIEFLTAIKSEEAILAYGNKGKNGAIILTLKEGINIERTERLERLERLERSDDMGRELKAFFINGQQVSENDIRELDSSKIKKMEVIYDDVLQGNIIQIYTD